MKYLLYSVLLFLISFSAGAKKYKLVEIQTNLGVIKVRLYEDTPKHSENFLKWVKEKHYDGLLFHRVIQDFMIQGGASDSKNAPEGKMVGMAELGYTIDAEILPGHPHVKGALAAARQGDEVNPEKKSSGEQFYIVQGKTYTDQQLDLLEQRRLLRARNKLGGELYQAVQQEHQTYLRRGQVQQADSIVKVINAKIEEMAVGKFIAIIPLFVGIGIVIADKICKWSPKAMRFGLVTTVASAIILVSTILDVWRYVIPAVIILIGIAYLLFSIFAVKQETKTKKKNYYVTYEPKDAETNIAENSESFEDSNSEE